MLIASIIILAFFVIAYIGILTFRFLDLRKKDYECIVRAPKALTIFAHVFYILFCIGVSIGAVLFIAFVENDTKGALIFIALFFGALGLAILILVTFPFVALKGNVIFRRNLFKIKTIEIENIRSIDYSQMMYVGRVCNIILKDGSKVEVYASSKGADELINSVKDRKEGRIYYSGAIDSENSEPLNEEHIIEPNEERMTLAQIGKEFRVNFPNYKRKQQLIYLFGFLSIPLIMICVSLILFITSKKTIWMICTVLAFIVLFMFGIMFFVFKENIGKELQHDDEWLGNKHKFEDPRVKGSAKKKFKSSLALPITLIACSLSVGGLTYGIEGNNKPIPQSQLIEISGEFEYIRNSGDKFEDEIAIGLKNDITEYRISSLDYPYFDSSFKTEVSIGDMVTIYIDSARKPNSLNYEGRTQWNYAYIVKSNAKEYLTYDNYLIAFSKNHQGAFVLFIVCLSISGACLIWIGTSFAVYKSRSKKETIDV